LDAEKWYSVTSGDIKRAGGGGLLHYYTGSYIKALVKLYPELVLKKGNFLKDKKGRKKAGWKTPGKQRKFFDEFARSKKFNPLDAEKWRSVTHNEIIKAGGSSLLRYHNRSHIEALIALYPELMLKKGCFLNEKRG